MRDFVANFAEGLATTVLATTGFAAGALAAGVPLVFAALRFGSATATERAGAVVFLAVGAALAGVVLSVLAFVGAATAFIRPPLAFLGKENFRDACFATLVPDSLRKNRP
jgi:hypothetical protein